MTLLQRIMQGDERALKALGRAILVAFALGLGLIWAYDSHAQNVKAGVALTPATAKPSNNIGLENEWYLDLLTGNVYGPKTLGQWPTAPVSTLLNSTLGTTAAMRADQAYQNYISRFWTGTQTGGHLAIINGNSISAPAANPPVETSVQKPWLWQYAVAWTVPYTYWKVTGSTDALARLTAINTWVQANWSAGDMAVCNNVGSQAATTLDDAAWVVRGLIELYDATADAANLTYAKALLDCMNSGPAGFLDGALMSAGQSHWYDATPASSASWSAGVLTITLSRSAAVAVPVNGYFNTAGFSNSAINGTFRAATVVGNVITAALAADPGSTPGGGWYHSGLGKGFDSLSYSLAQIYYYLAACPIEGGACPTATAYYNAAVTELNWANSNLERSANANCPQVDHLYWTSLTYGGVPIPYDVNGPLCPRASTIGLAASVVGLNQNLGAAIANMLVYNKTSTTSYLTKAQATAGSITALELDTCGALLDDRDARIGGFASYDFATKVIPSLDATTAATLKNAYLQVSLATIRKNTIITGSFSGDWCGPWNGVWTKAGYSPDQPEISAQAAILTISAALWP